ncbi:hypothetical protein DHEL01_v209676 [Diaporthe helianthi]|uniref:Uncharacterized protein n=1 Tax=Diaporthe helianthi TaxID=158607 RepID=A0A2P5HNU0_DIAHE|nr:hypothetical protein DHEL01_v209676 [Diaporthe helianthi]
MKLGDIPERLHEVLNPLKGQLCSDAGKALRATLAHCCPARCHRDPGPVEPLDFVAPSMSLRPQIRPLWGSPLTESRGNGTSSGRKVRAPMTALMRPSDDNNAQYASPLKGKRWHVAWKWVDGKLKSPKVRRESAHVCALVRRVGMVLVHPHDLRPGDGM